MKSIFYPKREVVVTYYIKNKEYFLLNGLTLKRNFDVCCMQNMKDNAGNSD